MKIKMKIMKKIRMKSMKNKNKIERDYCYEISFSIEIKNK